MSFILNVALSAPENFIKIPFSDLSFPFLEILTINYNL